MSGIQRGKEVTRRIAIYGKGGIGKSTISSNLSAALSERGVKVLQIGCDPKHDSTRLLTGEERCRTVLEYMKDVPPNERELGDLVLRGFGNTLCVEAGGPEPGVGCAGRGIITAFDLLRDLGIDSIDHDLVLYDVLGDVVCGGFAVPIRDGYADTIYVVTSGEYMSIYAANNILRGVSNYNPDRIGGIIFNSRGDDYEKARVEAFSEAVNIPIVARIERSNLFLSAEKESKTVVEKYPDTGLADSFRELANIVIEGKKHRARFLTETELEMTVLGMSRGHHADYERKERIKASSKPRVYASKSVKEKTILHGCAFSGAVNTCLSVEGLCTLMHSTRNCSQFAFQLTANSVKRAYRTDILPCDAALVPDAICTRLDEGSMIFGGNDKLRDCLQDAVDSGRKHIAVITSCAPGIIGDDVRGIVDQFKRTYPDVKIAFLEEDGNLNGDHMQGLIDACKGIVREFAVKDLPKQDCISMVGIKPMANNMISNIKRIEDILGRAGITVRCNIMGDCSVEDIERMTESKLSFLVTEDQFAMEQRSLLKDEYGMEFSDNPIGVGMRSTESWMKDIAKVFGKEKEIESALKEFREEYKKRIEHLLPYFEGKTVYVASLNRNVGWVSEIIDDLKMIPVRKTIMLRADRTYDDHAKGSDDYEITSTEDVGSIVADVNAKRPDFLFSMYAMDVDESIRQFKIPIVTEIGPYGATDMIERFIRECRRPKTEGWKKDVL